MAKKKKRSTSMRTASTSGRESSSAGEFDPDYTHVKKDLVRIGTLAGSFFVLLIVLSFILK